MVRVRQNYWRITTNNRHRGERRKLSLENGLERVLGDLASLGYDAEWHCIPAAAVGAPHRRDRLWIMAYAPGAGADRHTRRAAQEYPLSRGRGQHVANADDSRLERRDSESLRQCLAKRIAWARDPSISNSHSESSRWSSVPRRECGQWEFEPDVGRVANGVPSRVDRLKGLGNAVVPQIPELIGRAIGETLASDERAERERQAARTDERQMSLAL